MQEPHAPHTTSDPATLRFLYRTDAGRIDARVWWRGVVPLIAVFVVLTLGYLYLRPYTEHDLAKTPFLSLSVLGANLYVVFYAFAVIMIGICYYNLSAKRLRDRNRAAGLAGLLPFFALFCGALHWLQGHMDEAVPPTVLIAFDLLLVLILVWNVADLGGLVPPAHPHD